MADDHLQQPQRAELLAGKLRGLVRNSTGEELETALGSGSGPTGGFVVLSNGSRRGFFYAAGDEPIRTLGPALIWAERNEIAELDLVTDNADDAAGLARRAEAFVTTELPIRVWSVSATELAPAVPAPIATVPVLSPEEWAFAAIMSEAGARPVDDHGRLVAETAGLEVGRVRIAEDHEENAGQAVLDVGVGQADRELHQLVHTNMDADTALRRAIAAVVAHRQPGASPHPLNRMARERWLRAIVLETPSLVGADELRALPPLRPRATVLGDVPCAAMGPTSGDTAAPPTIVVCSTGVDLDLVPEAADYRQREDPTARLVLVIPERDRYPVAERLVSRLTNAELISTAVPWST